MATMTPSERGRKGNAALSTEQRSQAGKARAAALHDLESLANRIGKGWPKATPAKRRAVLARLREWGVIE